MVRVATMLLGLAALTAGSSSAAPSAFDTLPSFEIPAFDYPTLAEGTNPHRLLDELQANGIVALRNVPNYANVRAQYLQKAAECAVLAADSAEASFLSTKQFQDGTTRYTISTNAGQELAGSAANTQEICPGYQELYQEFSQLIEHAVNTFGSTLDATNFTASDGAQTITSRKLVSEAVRLDHFHAYQAATKTEDVVQHRELEFSLPLHEDHGLFIAMSAPKFFDVQATGGRKLVERQLAADRSGLVIQTAAGTRVRPVLNEDEVVIMMGTGASRWLKTSHALPAVMHGMKMPESMTGEGRSLRAWFGKMTLLPSYQRMLQNQDVVFDAHVNSTTRYLLQQKDAESELKTIGCASGRMLEASEGSCTFRVCSTKSGATAPADGCATVCNRQGHSDTDATECASQCTCTDSTGTAERCWMLCVANLPTNECALSSQTCSGQAMSCTSPISAPTTGTPVAPTPTSAAAATTAPVMAAPTPAGSGAITNAPGTVSPTPLSPSPGSSTPAPATTTGNSMGTSSSNETHSTTTTSTSAGNPNALTDSVATDVPTAGSMSMGSGSSAGMTTTGGSSSTTVTAPATTPVPTTAAPSSAAGSILPSTAAVLVSTIGAFALALFQ
ncbi:hypothetical protein FI667_g13289, partial [Globisporangium splendens]